MSGIVVGKELEGVMALNEALAIQTAASGMDSGRQARLGEGHGEAPRLGCGAGERIEARHEGLGRARFRGPTKACC